MNRLFSQFLPVLEELTKNEDTRKLLLSTMCSVCFQQRAPQEVYRLVGSRSSLNRSSLHNSRDLRNGGSGSLPMVASPVIALLGSSLSTLGRSGSTLSRSGIGLGMSRSSMSSGAWRLAVLLSLHSSRVASESQRSLRIISFSCKLP